MVLSAGSLTVAAESGDHFPAEVQHELQEPPLRRLRLGFDYGAEESHLHHFAAMCAERPGDTSRNLSFHLIRTKRMRRKREQLVKEDTVQSIEV